MFRRLLKLTLISFFAFLTLLIGLVLFSQTPLFKNWIKGKIVDQISQLIEGRATIEDLSGNLFTRVSLSGIHLIDQQDTILAIGKIDLVYEPLKLFRKKISIENLTLAQTKILLSQKSDSSWNISQIIKKDSLKKDSKEMSAGDFPFSVELMNCQISSSTLNIQAIDELIPHKVSIDNIEFSGHYNTQDVAFELKQCQLQSFSPHIKIENLIFLFRQEKDSYSLENFALKTAQNRLSMKGRATQLPPDTASLSVETTALQWQEFQMFLPDLTFNIQPRLGLEMVYKSDSLFIQFAIEDDVQKATIETSLFHLKAFLNNHRDSLVYRIHATLAEFELHSFYADIPIQTRLNGDIHLSGRGLSAETAQLDLSGNLSNSLLGNQTVSQLQFSGSYIQGNGTVTLDISEPGSEARLTAHVQNLLKNPQYTLNAAVSGLNLSNFLQADSSDTDLNLTLAVQGSGFDPDHIKARYKLAISPSNFRGLQIDTLFSLGQITGPVVNLDTLQLSAFHSIVTCSGRINLQGNSSLSYRIQLPELQRFAGFIAVDTLQGSCLLHGQLLGRVDSLFNTSNYQVENLNYNGIYAEKLAGNVQFLMNESDYGGSAVLELKNLNIGGLEIDSTHIEGEFEQDQIELNLGANFRENVTTEMTAVIRIDSLISIELPYLRINLDENRWEGGSPTTKFILNYPDITVEDFELSSPGDPVQKITLGGQLSLEGEQNFLMDVSQLDIAALSPYLSLPFALKGLGNFHMKVGGVAESPEIEGRLKIDDIQIGKYSYRDLEGKVSYRDNELTFNVGLNARRPSVLSLEGHLPVLLSFNQPSLTILPEEPFTVRFRADSLGIDIFTSDLGELRNLGGIIVSDLKIGNTLQNPWAEGYFRLINGAFQIPELGIKYDRIALDVKVEDSTLFLQQLVAHRNEGFVKADGQLAFSDNLLKAQISSSQFQLQARDFYLVQHKDFEILVKADGNLAGGPDSSQFAGTVEINRSSFNVPRILELAGKTTLQEPTRIPLLVQVTQICDPQSVSIAKESTIEDTISINGSAESSKFLNNVSGNLTITLPRNTWLKGLNWRIELDGKLDLVKQGKDFRLFGSIGIVRGNYDLLGRRFNIREGRLNFKGETEFNPDIVLEAELEMRTSSRDKKLLVLYLSGEVLNPVYRFTLDGREISEADAVSYVVTGRSIDDLSFGEQAGLDESSLATDLTSGLLTRQLNKQIGQDLNLDYLELKGKNNWQSATFVVGKYLTNELFISYQREFGDTDDNDIAPELVTVEYEITRNIYLQVIEGDSRARGADIIFKVER